MKDKTFLNPPTAGALKGIQSTDRPMEEPRIFEHVDGDGNVVMLTKSEIDAKDKIAREKLHEEKLQLKEDRLMADWGAEMDNRGIMFDGDLPKNRSTPIDLMCGCERKAKFKANIPQLFALKTRNEKYCPRCHLLSKPDNLAKVVKEKGGSLLTAYTGANKKVRVDCGKGHAFQATPANLTKKSGGSWCPHCNAKTNGEPRLREILAERGHELVDYRLSRDPKKVILNAYGDVKETAYTSLLATPPTFGTLRGDRRVRMFFDEDNMRCYGLIDEIPSNLPQALVDIIACEDEDEIGVGATLKECHQMLADAIKTYEGESDFKCVNVLHNAEWISPGVYTWGKFPAFDGTLVSTADAVPS
jgi:hypothetical protein